MTVRAKLKDIAPGTVFNAGPIDVRVLEHFTDGRTLLIADRERSVTPNAGNANNARNVNTDGSLNNNNAYNGNNGVRPDLVENGTD